MTDLKTQVPKLKKLPENKVGRDFVVGDIHGCYSLLMSELRKVDFDKARDRLISVGDLVDRGPESYKCLSLPYELWFYGVRGNHEEMMLHALNTGDFELWTVNGGAWAFELDSLHQLKVLANDAVSRMPYAIEVECAGATFGIIHAEVPASDWRRLEWSDTAEMTWGRTRIKKGDDSVIKGVDMVICGHTIVPDVICYGNACYIDTGAFHTGRLTLINLAELANPLEGVA